MTRQYTQVEREQILSTARAYAAKSRGNAAAASQPRGDQPWIVHKANFGIGTLADAVRLLGFLHSNTYRIRRPNSQIMTPIIPKTSAQPHASWAPSPTETKAIAAGTRNSAAQPQATQ
jgi:hypothetical protein